jgi:hypothetical protein
MAMNARDERQEGETPSVPGAGPDLKEEEATV